MHKISYTTPLYVRRIGDEKKGKNTTACETITILVAIFLHPINTNIYLCVRVRVCASEWSLHQLLATKILLGSQTCNNHRTALLETQKKGHTGNVCTARKQLSKASSGAGSLK